MGHKDITIFFNGMQNFCCKIRRNRDGAKLNLMNSFQMSDILKGLFCNKIVDCPQSRYLLSTILNVVQSFVDKELNEMNNCLSGKPYLLIIKYVCSLS